MGRPRRRAGGHSAAAEGHQVQPLREADLQDATVYAESIGAELVSRDDLEALRTIAILLEPVTLQAGPSMATVEWSRRHDAVVLRILAAVDDGKRPVLGVGKQWISGAPEGRAHLMGWWTKTLQRYGRRRGEGWVQLPAAPKSAGPHDDGHHDYGTTTMLVRPKLVRCAS